MISLRIHRQMNSTLKLSSLAFYAYLRQCVTHHWTCRYQWTKINDLVFVQVESRQLGGVRTVTMSTFVVELNITGIYLTY